MPKTAKKEMLYILFFMVIAILFFQSNLTFSYLQMGDYIIAEFKNIKDALLKTPYLWADYYFTVESAITTSIHPRNIILFFTSVEIFPQVSIIFHLFVMGFGAFLFFREKKLNIYAAMFGSVAMMLSNAFTTLILPGHLGKFETYAYFPFVLYFLSKAMNSGYIRYFVFSGAMLAVSFLGGALDVAMYFSIIVGFYFLYLLYIKKGERKITQYIKEDKKNIFIYCIKFLIVIILSFVMSLQMIMITRSTQEQGAAGVSNKKELYSWATRWSYPPEETLGFILPGFFGYYSGSDTHPYWGRIANVAGESKTSNYSLTATNIGIATFIFLLFGIFVQRNRFKEKTFWIIASLFLLIAGFGRYFPLIYGVLFQIPIFRDARNPNKFIEIIGIPLSVISAFGFDYVMSVLKARKDDRLLEFFDSKENNYKYVSIITKIVFIITATLLILTIVSFLFRGSIEDMFYSSWQNPRASLIARNIVFSFARACSLFATVYLIIKNIFSLSEITNKDKYFPIAPFLCFVLLSAFDMNDLNQFGILILGILAIFVYMVYSSKKSVLNIIPLALIVVLALDLYQSSNYFLVKSNINKMNNTTPIVEHIKTSGGNTTTAPVLIPYLYRYTTHTMPYHDIQLTEPPAASRLSREITEMFNAFRINDYATYQPRLFDLLGVRYILSPTYLDKSILSNEFVKITEYQDEFSAAVLYELKGYREKYEFASTILQADDFDIALSEITSERFNVKNDVVVEDKNVRSVISRPANYNININKISKNETVFEVETDSSGVLVFKERYDKNWKVFVDDKEEELLKANILFRGVHLDEGKHSVVFKYSPSMLYLYSTILGYIITLLTIIVCFIIDKKKNKLV